MPAPWIANEPGDWDVNWLQSDENREGVDTAHVRTGSEFDGGTSRVANSPLLPARTTGGVRWTWGTNSAPANGITHFAWVNDAGTEILRVTNTSLGNQQLQYWSGSAWVGVGSAQPVSLGDYRAELTFDGLGTAAGVLTFRHFDMLSGSLVAEWSATGLDLTACTNISKARVRAQSGGIMAVAEYIVCDDPPGGLVGYNRAPNSDGIDTDGGTTYAAIDDLTLNDADFLSLAASGNKHSVKGTARDFAGQRVDAVTISFRARCGATGPTQVRAYLVLGGTRYYHPDTVTLSTSFAAYQVAWELNPANGLPWVGADAESASLEWGWEAV